MGARHARHTTGNLRAASFLAPPALRPPPVGWFAEVSEYGHIVSEKVPLHRLAISWGYAKCNLTDDGRCAGEATRVGDHLDPRPQTVQIDIKKFDGPCVCVCVCRTF